MTDALTERRAVFIYDAAMLAALAAQAPVVPEPFALREQEFKDQFYEVIEKQCGPHRKYSAEELHEEWVISYREMGWVYGETRNPEAKTHPDMVSYWRLGQLERDKDDVFIALCDIARLWIRD